MEILYSFRLVLEGKTGNEIPKSSRLESLEKILANKFSLSDSEDNTSGTMNRGGIADLSSLRTLLAISQKSWQKDSGKYGLLVAYAHLAASRNL